MCGIDEIKKSAGWLIQDTPHEHHGYPGVSWQKNAGKWSRISVAVGFVIILGFSTTFRKPSQRTSRRQRACCEQHRTRCEHCAEELARSGEAAHAERGIEALSTPYLEKTHSMVGCVQPT